MCWIIPGIICLVLVWIYLKTLLFALLGIGLIGWVVSRLIVYLPEGTAMKINGPLGQQILFCWQNHGLDANKNVVDCPKASYHGFRWLGLAGLLGRRERSRVMYLGKKGVLKDAKTALIPLEGRRMEVPVQAITSDGKKVEARLAARVRIRRLTVDDWAQVARNELWARGGEVISQNTYQQVSAGRTTMCAAMQAAVNGRLGTEGVEILDLSMPSVAETR